MPGWRNVTQAVVDSASVTEIVEVYSYSRPDAVHRWAWQSALEVTACLLTMRHVAIMPAPGPSGQAVGPHADLAQGLAFVERPGAPSELAAIAAAHVRRWSRRSAADIRNAFQTIRSETHSYEAWLKWCIGMMWPDHAQRLGGLFDRLFLHELALILGLEQEFLQEVWSQSGNAKTVAHWAADFPDTADFRAARDAYVVSALIRGRYHDYIASKHRQQIIHAPFRDRPEILGRLSSKPGIEFKVANTEWYLANIVVANAFGIVGLRRRIRRWLQTVQKLRLVNLSEDPLDLRPRASEDGSLTAAVRAARRVGVRTRGNLVDEALQASFDTGSGILTSWCLQGWAGLAASMATSLITRRLPAFTERHFHTLALAGPGRIRREWRKGQ